jgi:hypothetical protein
LSRIQGNVPEKRCPRHKVSEKFDEVSRDELITLVQITDTFRNSRDNDQKDVGLLTKVSEICRKLLVRDFWNALTFASDHFHAYSLCSGKS